MILEMGNVELNIEQGISNVEVLTLCLVHYLIVKKEINLFHYILLKNS